MLFRTLVVDVLFIVCGQMNNYFNQTKILMQYKNIWILEAFMKKTVLTLILTLFIAGCSNISISHSKNEENKTKARIRSNFSLNLEKRTLSSTSIKDFEINDELAVEIGNSILKSIYGDKAMCNTTSHIEYIEDDGVFWFVRGNPDQLGGDYNVAINKYNGKIELIWIGE